MSIVLAALAIVLLLYAPGHACFRATGDHEGARHRLLFEVLLSASLTSWLGLLLAELGWFSLWRLCLLQAGIAAGGLWINRHGAAHPYGRLDASGAVLLVLTWVWLSPPLDTRLLSGDSTGYLASGTQLAASGSLIVNDTTLQSLSLDQKRILFPSVAADRGSPPYLRLLGAYVLRDLSGDELLPAFHHLLSVWVALAQGIVGEAHQEWLITLFGGLAIWSVAAFAYGLWGVVGALLATAALMLSLPQYWYSRFLMPEVPAQFFLWGGLALLMAPHGDRRSEARTGLAAGIGLGVAALMRLENMLFVAAALTLTRLLAGRFDVRLRATVLAASLVWLHLVLHTSCWRTHYWGNLQDLLLLRSPLRLAGVAALVAVAGLTLFRWRAHQTETRLWLVSILMSVVVVVGLASDAARNWSSLLLLASYCGIPLLFCGWVGLLSLRPLPQAPSGGFILAMVLVSIAALQFLIAPNATPVPIWAIRRAVPLLVPGLALGFSGGVLLLLKKASPLTAVAAALLVLGTEGPLVGRFRAAPAYLGSRHHLAVLGELTEPRSVLLIDPRLTGYGLGPQLWAARGNEVFYVSGTDRERILGLLGALAGRSVYWIGDANGPAPSVGQVSFAPVATYQFALLTPQLELGAGADSIVGTEAAIAIYRIAQ